MKKNKTVKIIIICILVLIMLLSGGYLINYYLDGRLNTDAFKNNSSTTSSSNLPDNPIDFSALQTKNTDIYAWIQIPNTRVDYPVLQSSVEDDNYYINRDIDKQVVKAGSIYSQRLNSKNFSDPNTILYGHNMKNGTMFRDLRKFRDKEFFEQNEYMYVYYPGHILTYRIYSAYRYDDRHILNSFDFNNKEVYAKYLEMTQNPDSMVKNVREGVTLTTDDRILTLSTCMDYGKNRYLVQGVLIKDELTK